MLNGITIGMIWDGLLVAAILFAGVYLTAKLRFIQITRFGYAMRNTSGKMFSSNAGEGEVTPFQAVSTALAATIGTGNITGVIAAVALGGAGAMFWLWVSAVLGMAIKYAEVVLAVRYRERNCAGELVGGPMYYIKNGLSGRWHILAILFCISGMLAAFGIGNAIQIGNVSGAVSAAVKSLLPGAGISDRAIKLSVGILSAVFVSVTVFGGMKRLGRVTEKLVPLVGGVYILSCLAVIVTHAVNLPTVMVDIVRGAFDPRAVIGGGAGITVRSAVSYGVRRGVFSNEAGLGSSPIAHAATSEKDPVKQGMYGIFEVFADIIVICTLTGLTILTSEAPIYFGSPEGNRAIIESFSGIMGNTGAVIVVAGVIAFFALLTVLSWGLYGVRCWEYIFGEKSAILYKTVFIFVIIISPIFDMERVWRIADTLNGLMIIPNLIAVLMLSGVTEKLTRSHFAYIFRN